MVYIDQPDRGVPQTLKAFMVPALSDGELQEFKRNFEKGANVHLNPMVHLKILHVPGSHMNKTHAQMRTLENEAGNTDAFVVIDRNVVDKGAVWYVADFADEDDVEMGYAAGTDVVMRALICTQHLGISVVCYAEGNPPMGEELESLEEQLLPLQHDSQQLVPLGEDDDADETWSTDEIEVIAASGEYEETTDNKIRKKMSPIPDKAVRLKQDLAQREHIISDWTWSDDAEGFETPDGSQTFPAGSMRMCAKYDSRVPRIQYEWPAGSL